MADLGSSSLTDVIAVSPPKRYGGEQHPAAHEGSRVRPPFWELKMRRVITQKPLRLMYQARTGKNVHYRAHLRWRAAQIDDGSLS